ncbi:MAG TPA: DUF3455 domain-containing protein [Hyphomicrobium sp.]|nr:DUF3455 domain-containing protein [Hyphomicrobium sp.]
MLSLLFISFAAAAAETTLPAAIAASGEAPVLTAHAIGTQIYECKAGSDGKLAWTFREPAATLTADDKIFAHHYAGPTWKFADGSAVVGKVLASAPGKTANDIAWLKLDVVSHQGNGTGSEVITVQRINTVGGVISGECDHAGATRAMPYSADYVFLRKG